MLQTAFLTALPVHPPRFHRPHLTASHPSVALPHSAALRASISSPTPSSPSNKTFQNVTWDQVETMTHHLASLSKPINIDLILAITRGGLVPATLICEALELRNILSATVMFYTDAGEQFFGMAEPRFLSFPTANALEGRRVLVVDDVWDSGRTAHAVKLRVQRANPELVKVAVMHYKPSMNVVGEEPDFFCHTTENWIIYPWERSSPVVQEIGETEEKAVVG
eukprot:GFKZ01006141.1.p1 GENE.GFKZ01006141.1~~GFKZ01006141.1.p1  ORF type:complete len:223 (-),score=35.59 GFKZ01006141.1:1037-1705(-)